MEVVYVVAFMEEQENEKEANECVEQNRDFHGHAVSIDGLGDCGFEEEAWSNEIRKFVRGLRSFEGLTA